MRRILVLFSLLWLGFAAPSYASSVFPTQGAAGAACNANHPGLCGYYSGTGNCSGSGYNSSTMGAGCYKNLGGPEYYWWTLSGSCPAGQNASGPGGSCVAGASEAQKTAAGAAATAAAAGDGLDATSQAAANSKAQTTLDAWMAAGKPESEAQAAAASAASMESVANVYSRYAAEAATMKTTCQTSGVNSSACITAQATYTSHMQAAGVDPSTSQVFVVETEDGRTVEYHANHLGWDVYSTDGNGRVLGWLGQTASVDFSPSVVVEPAFGAQAPGYANAKTGEPMRDPMKPPLIVLESTPTVQAVLSPETSSLAFFDPGTGSLQGRVTQAPDGSYSSTGTVPATATSQLSKGLVAAGETSGGAATGGTGGGGVVSGSVDIVDGSGAGAYTAVTAGIDSAKNAFLGLFTGSSSATLAHGWDWGIPSLSLPSVSCSAWNITSGGWTLPIDPCPVAEKIRDIGGFVLYVLTVFGLFRILTGRTD